MGSIALFGGPFCIALSLYGDSFTFWNQPWITVLVKVFVQKKKIKRDSGANYDEKTLVFSRQTESDCEVFESFS